MTRKKIMLMFLAGIFLHAQVPAQDPPKEPLKEYVSVTNVELILKVIKDGQTLGGFGKKDFKLLENGIERPINGFFEIRKRMSPQKDEEGTIANDQGRLFLLFFWTTQKKTDIKAHLNTFFSEVYSPNDRVVLASNDTQLEITSPSQIESVRTQFEHKLELEIDKTQNKWTAIHRELSHEIDYTITRVRLNKNKAEVKALLSDFTGKYSLLMKEVELMTRTTNMEQLEQMSESLRTINTAKWALLFYESNRIPMVNVTDLTTEARDVIICDEDNTIVNKWFEDLADIEINMSRLGNQAGLLEKLRSSFIQADTVFHFLELNTASTAEVKKADEDPFLAYKPLSSGWESVMKNITQITGGRISQIESDPSLIKPLFDMENISYLITYVPSGSKNIKRKIELLLIRPIPNISNGNLFYGKRIEMEQTPNIQIDLISHEQNVLRLTCSHYYPIFSSRGQQGQLQVHISGQTQNNPPSDLFTGDIEYFRPVDIPLNFTQMGQWELNIEVTDLMTTLKDTKKYQLNHISYADTPDRAENSFSRDLDPLLEKCAHYSELLKKTALRFFCNETVTEKIASPSKTHRYKTWHYDYQIVLQDGKLNESRSQGVSKKKKNKDQEESTLETLFKSHYSFFLPATFLSLDRQNHYHYTPIDTDSIQNRPTTHLLAVPKNKDVGLPAGELWIDETDGSVLQIKLDPTSLTGFKSRYKLAKEAKKSVTISDTHQYFTRFKSLQFPTSTFITEHQSVDDFPNMVSLPSQFAGYASRFEPTFYSVLFQYDEFRFFDVNTNEQITGWVEE